MIISSANTSFYGAILSGGSAERLGGTPKGLLNNTGGMSIIDSLILAFNSAGISNVVISANDPAAYEQYNCKVLPDKHLDVGPLAGIDSILRYCSNKCDAIIIMPCDMPAITANDIETLKNAFLETDLPIAVAAEPDTLWHPLSLVIADGYANQISRDIAAGTRKVSKVWRQIGAETVIFNDTSIFQNLNTPRDVETWQKKCRA